MSHAPNENLRVGIIGAGNMGSTHARHWAKVPGASVVGIADTQKHKADALAQAISSDAQNTAAAFDSVDDMLRHAPEINVVSVCVPTYLHRIISEAALNAGKHVFCEKPLALSVSDCDAMIAAAQSANRRLSVGQVVRFFPEYAQAKKLVEAGSVGNVAAVRVRRGGGFPHTDTDWFADVDKSGGVLFDLLVHDLDWLLWCFGPVVRVHAHALTPRLKDKTVDHLDYALVTLRHKSGVISHAEGTWADPGGFATAWEIAGDTGLLTHDSRRTGALSKHLRQTEGAGFPLPSSPLAPSDDPYFCEILAFARALQTGEPLAVTPEDGREAVRVASAALVSAQTGAAQVL